MIFLRSADQQQQYYESQMESLMERGKIIAQTNEANENLLKSGHKMETCSNAVLSPLK